MAMLVGRVVESDQSISRVKTPIKRASDAFKIAESGLLQQIRLTFIHFAASLPPTASRPPDQRSPASPPAHRGSRPHSDLRPIIIGEPEPFMDVNIDFWQFRQNSLIFSFLLLLGKWV